MPGGVVGSNQIVLMDRTGKAPVPVGAPGGVLMPTISPDEKSVGYTRNGAGASDLWLRDLDRGAEKRFTTSPSLNGEFNWSPNADRAVFVSNRGGAFDIFQKATTGLGQDELLLPTRQTRLVSQWSHDGRFIVYSETGKKQDLWFLPLAQDGSLPPLAERKPVLFLQTEFNEGEGQLSPDSHWMAYVSDESGRLEVYVRPFPPADGVWPISTAGGEQPRWSGNGKELFYVAADGKMMAVPIKASPGTSGTKLSFEPGMATPLFDAHLASPPGGGLTFQYDVTKDGKRFLVDTTAAAASAKPLTVVVGWDAGFKK
jgi:Tol biopolymer transport system component